ncbi:MAG TPA: molybdenum cofactor guanylyltransferase [Gammaproteobacteria bacterium]|nr:molybdenum cofactor guanylyltransferase [Gammaproteobacteria bacterium]
MNASANISAIILAGGEGRRAGGRDKGLIDYQGKPLIEHVIEHIRPQCDDIIISANRNLDSYGRYTDKVISDEADSYRGPLAGIAACLPHCAHALALVVACDMPQLPAPLADRLLAHMTDADVAIACVDGHHQLALLLKTSLQKSIDDRLAGNRLKLIDWVRAQKHASISFDDIPQAFANLNSLPAD